MNRFALSLLVGLAAPRLAAQEAVPLSPGTIELSPVPGSYDATSALPERDLEWNLCHVLPKDTVAATDCKIPGPSSNVPPDGKLRLEILGSTGGSPRIVDLRFRALAGSGEIESSCGRWLVEWVPVTDPVSQLELATTAEGEPGEFVGTLAGIHQFSFTRLADGRRVELLRSFELALSGAWEVLPNPSVPPGGTNLSLVARQRNPIAYPWHCQRRVPMIME